MAVAAPRRRADRDKHRLGLGDRPREIGGEIEPLLPHIGGATRRSTSGSNMGMSPSRRRAILVASLSTFDHRVLDAAISSAATAPASRRF
jgi:hypothetical protein